jgi:SPP1 gp7 family putative phage head morphogenesis protein
MPQFSISALVAKVDVNELRRRGEPVVRLTVQDFGTQGMERLGDDVFVMSNHRVSEYLRNWSSTRIVDVNNSTRTHLRTALQRDYDAGKTYGEMGTSIMRVFDVASGSRAVTIARTEVVRASNFGSIEAYRQSGIEQKEWQSVLSPTTRDSHAELDGTVIDIDDAFTIGALSADYPGDFGDPAEDINCQCGVLPVVGNRGFVGSKSWHQKALTRARVPYTRMMKRSMVAGFEAQRKEVMTTFNAMVEVAA